jgi:hypothetical protein
MIEVLPDEAKLEHVIHAATIPSVGRTSHPAESSPTFLAPLRSGF